MSERNNRMKCGSITYDASHLDFSNSSNVLPVSVENTQFRPAVEQPQNINK
jgi:hypothetical protein